MTSTQVADAEQVIPFHEDLAKQMIDVARGPADEFDDAVIEKLHDLALSASAPELLATYLATEAAEALDEIDHLHGK